MRWPAILVSFVAALSASAALAQETRVGEKGFESPPATIDQAAFLIGQWIGEGIGGATALESWLPPTGNTMVGTFVQQTGEGDIRFTEHLYLMEENGSLVVKLKHFNADLTGWEDKEGMVTFRLLAIEDCAAYFHGLTLRCEGADGLVAAVRMQSDKPEIQELLFNYRRMESGGDAGRCPDAMTTRDMDECYAEILDRADGQRALYLATAMDRHKDRPELAAKVEESGIAFKAYRDAECGAVLEDWIEGTIRGVMTLGCRIDLTDRRTHTIWQNWLTYPDSTPPVLPEPKPTK